MIAVVDYGMGNLRSVQKAFEIQGFDARITNDKNLIRDASHIVLPGVGAVADAMQNLEKARLTGVLLSEVKAGKPFLGICLGMQMLFDKSREDGLHDCLGLIRGEVVPFEVDLWVPHIGWNDLDIKDDSILGPSNKETYVYFVHSYHGVCADREDVAAITRYGYEFVSAVRRDNIFGVQFHPEKSGNTGLEILKKFGGINI